MQRIARKAARRCLQNITAVLVDSDDSGIPSSSADVVLLIDAFHMITDHDALFQEIHRLLKPDGLLYMDPGHMKGAEVKRIVENVGLLNVISFDGKNMQLRKRLDP